MQCTRRVGDQVNQQLVDCRCMDHMVVVEYQDEVVGEFVQLVDQQDGQVGKNAGLRRVERIENISAKPRSNGCQCSRYGRKKHGRIVVAVVERQPGVRDIRLHEPGADERSLTVSRRRYD